VSFLKFYSLKYKVSAFWDRMMCSLVGSGHISGVPAALMYRVKLIQGLYLNSVQFFTIMKKS